MRALALFLITAGLVPFAFMTPFTGVLMWEWISLMNPHQLVAGFFAELPYALMVAILTLVSWALSKEPKALIRDNTGWAIVVLMIWLSVSAAVGLAPAQAIY